MVYSLGYRRPARRESSTTSASISGEEKQRSIDGSIHSGNSGMSAGIPNALSFDRIIAGGTCPPATVRDFMNYLRYIEFSAENLQFYLWFRDYTARFEALPEREKALSSPWTQEQADAEAAASGPGTTHPVLADGRLADALRDTDFAAGMPKGMMSSQHNPSVDPFGTPTKTRSMEEMQQQDGMGSGSESEFGSSQGWKSGATRDTHNTHTTVAEAAFDDAGMKWKPFTSQPYRDEVNRIISIYIAEGSMRELNLSGRERAAVLHALQNTTHPSAFRLLVTSVEYSLRQQAHPNFIRWTICNGNRPRVVFARGLGIFTILCGLLADLLLTLSSAPRAWRVLPLLLWVIGFATLIAGWKGMCVVLHGMHHRHLRPWELFSDDSNEQVLDEKALSRDSLLSSSTNSYEDAPWVARYKKRNIIRKIFDREVWITEPALRQIQDTIFLQAVLGGLVISCVFVGIFCAVPKGNFY